MKTFIIAAMLGVAASAGADCAYAQADGDSVERIREDSDYQATVLRAKRVVVYSTDMKGVPAGGTTTQFGFFPFADLAPQLEREVVSAP